MATRQMAGTAAARIGTTTIMAALAVIAGLVITTVVAAAIMFSPAPAAPGTYTLSELDDWGTRNRALPADLGPLPDYPLRHP